MKNNNEKLLLIDGNSVLFRAFYATAYGSIMKTSFGAYTNAIYAFANMLNKAIKLINPTYCVVAFDKGKHTFRHELNPEYKAGRKETPVELVEQFKLVRDMLVAYNIPYLEYDDIEADDIIGSLAKKYDIETCIFSSDHDLLQLIDDTTSVYVMKKGMSDLIRMNKKELFEEYSLKPYQIIDFKGLAGDKSDNIKGVEGVGEKTAISLLTQYDICENIYEHIDEIKGKLKEKLIKDKDSCMLSKKLATIKTDVDINIDLEEFRLNINKNTRNDFFMKYEMKSLIPKDEIVNNRKIEYSKVSKISNKLLENSFIFLVSNEFSYFERELFGFCLINENGEEYIDIKDALKDEGLLKYLNSDKHKVFYSLKDTLHCLDYNQIKINKVNNDDLSLMAFLSNNYNTDVSSTLHNYGYFMSCEIKDVFGSIKKPLDLNEEKVISYAFELTNYLYEIYKVVSNEINDKEMTHLYKDIELELVYVLYSMEKNGFICDEKELDTIAESTLKKTNKLEKDIYQLVGHEFNINSPIQLKEVLYDELGLPDLKKGSTSAEVLIKLVDYNDVIPMILSYRKYAKLYSTYAEGLKKYISKDKKIHSIFSQTITNTGRLSSSEPNLQNISVRDDEGREIRKAFKPEFDYIISCDYSQIELRVLASLANEEKMLDAFNNGIDIHEKTAMDVFGIDKDEVTPLIRRQAKAINFGVVYGISDFGLANQTNMSFKDAKVFIDNYFKTYPSIKEYLDNNVKFCVENKFVKTILNRRRYINEIADQKWQMREFGKRAAMNATIQGSAADIIKIAMVNIYKKINELNLKSKIILQIHDELVFDVCEDELETMKKLIKDTMSNAYELKCKLDSSLSYGKDLYEAK